MSKLRLYAKVARLFLGRKIVTGADIGESYSLVSQNYAQAFLNTMHLYNDALIGELGKHLSSRFDQAAPLPVLDLAAGTGYNSLAIRRLFPAAELTLVDISEGMLEQSRKNLPENTSFVAADMLHYLESSADQAFDVIICAWAIKYRSPLEVIRQCRRVLKPGGCLAVIVNKKDTLPQVVRIYPQLLAKHAHKVTKLMLPLPNPRDLTAFDNWFLKNSFSKVMSMEGFHDFNFNTGRELAEFVVSTGALAGFDIMLDLRDRAVQADMARLFEEHGFIKATHRFVYGIYQKPVKTAQRWLGRVSREVNSRNKVRGVTFMNKQIIARMCFDRRTLSNFFKIHRRFSQSKKYRLGNMIKCGLNAIKHDRLVRHEDSFLLNSFIPPLNSPAFLNIALQVPGEGAEFFKNHIEGKRLAPISAYIAAIGKCRYNCWHCSAASAGQAELDTNSLLLVVKKLQDLGVGIIGFTGGEPLLRDDLELVISSIDKQKSISLVFSTGFGLTPERAAGLKAAGLFGIAVSLDSVQQEKHDKMRGYPGAYEQALQAIRNAKKAGLYTMSQTVCTRELMAGGEIYDLAAMLKAEGIDEMRIIEPLPCGKLSGPHPALLSLDEQNELKNLHIRLNRDKRYPKASVFPYFESAEQFGCGAGSQHSYVDTAGNYGPCDFLSLRYGNLLTDDIRDVWQQMHTSAGGPHCSCLAKAAGTGSDLGSDTGSSTLPKFYRLLGGSVS